jgi:hypothetical protein
MVPAVLASLWLKGLPLKTDEQVRYLLYVYVYIYIWMYICMYIYVCIYIHWGGIFHSVLASLWLKGLPLTTDEQVRYLLYIYIYIYIWMYVCMYIYVCIYTHWGGIFPSVLASLWLKGLPLTTDEQVKSTMLITYIFDT